MRSPAVLVLVVASLLALLAGGCGSPSTFDDSLAEIARPYEFDILRWELGALGHEIGHALSLPHLSGTAMNAFVPAPITMTMGGFGQNANVCPALPFPSPTSQCGTVRLQSVCHQNGVDATNPSHNACPASRSSTDGAVSVMSSRCSGSTTRPLARCRSLRDVFAI